MAYLGSRSLRILSTCNWDIQKIVQEAIKSIDFTVICGFRDKKNQTMAYYSGASKLQWPASKHNQFPSEAFDFIPCPFKSWNDTDSFARVVDVCKSTADKLNIEITCGADWKWKDWGHIELK